MKKRIILSVLAIIFVLSLISGAVVAWFTDVDTTENVFQAGTVLIEADSSVIMSQNFDPAGAVYIYGVEQGTGHLYEINVETGVSYKLYNTPNYAPNNMNSPNGLAFDNPNRRLYFAVYQSSAAPESKLYFYDFREKELVYAGKVDGVVAGATYGLGYFWYIKNVTDELYRINFKPDGTFGEEDNEFFAAITEGARTFRFGDIAFDISDGILYGSSLASEGHDTVFFTYDTENGIYNEVKSPDSPALQISFGSDRVLYGHSTGTGEWYSIDRATGTRNYKFTTPEKFTDLASGYISTWNPGDCEKFRVWIRNTGTKKIYLRLVPEVWWEGGLQVDNVHIYFCDGMSPGDEYSDPGWEKAENWEMIDSGAGQGINRYTIHYTGPPIEPGEEVELCLMICLDGPDTGNEYQGLKFFLTFTVEAIQSTHEAAFERWSIGFLNNGPEGNTLPEDNNIKGWYAVTYNGAAERWETEEEIAGYKYYWDESVNDQKVWRRITP